MEPGGTSGFAGSLSTSRYNLRSSCCRTAMLLRITSTAITRTSAHVQTGQTKIPTKRRLILWYMRIWSHGLVLTIHQHPQPNLALWIVEVLRHSRLERTIRLILQHSEGWQIGWRPVLLIKACEVEAFVLRKRLIRDNLWHRVNKLMEGMDNNHLLTFAVRYRCCSSRSRFLASICNRSSSSRRSETR